MTPPAWTWADIGGTDIAFGLMTLIAFVAGVGFLIEYRRLALVEGTLSGLELFATFGTLPLACALAWGTYSRVNKHRLLRGECRYTVVWVYENHHHKGDQESRFEF